MAVGVLVRGKNWKIESFLGRPHRVPIYPFVVDAT